MGVFCVCVWGGTWEVRNKTDCCDGLWGRCGVEETQVLHSEGRQTGGYCMHRERAACNEHMKGEGRGYEVQLTAGMTVCVFPRTGLLPAVCHALPGVCGSWSAPPTTSCVASGCWGAALLCPTAAAQCQQSVFGGPPPRELHRPGLSTLF